MKGGGEESICRVREVTDAGPSGHLSWYQTQAPSPVLSLCPWPLPSSMHLAHQSPEPGRLRHRICERDHMQQPCEVNSQTASQEPAAWVEGPGLEAAEKSRRGRSWPEPLTGQAEAWQT